MRPFSEKELHAVFKKLIPEDTFVFLETTKLSGEEHRSYLFTKPKSIITCKPGESPQTFFEQAEKSINNGHYLAGWLSYEFGYLLEPVLAKQLPPLKQSNLAELYVFEEPLIFDHKSGEFTGSQILPQSGEQADIGPDFSIKNVRLNQDQQSYVKTINRIKEYIAAGDTYQVNYTLKHLFDFEGSYESLYRTLRRNQSVSYSSFIKNGDWAVMSFSPELFFRKQGDLCTVRPMKGTVRRGNTATQDKNLMAFLQNDIKNRSENVMIVDLLRNDLGRLSELGSVQVKSLFDIETYETLHQMTSTIQGKLRPGISLNDFFTAIFPSGSVTGAPKIRTMEIIRELELAPRGVYTGGIGFFSPNGDAVFNVPIRTVVLAGNKGEMGIGSGIVYDSDPINEWEECRLKAKFVTKPRSSFKLIESLLWIPDQGYWLLKEHLERIISSANHFQYPLAVAHLEKRLAVEQKKFTPDSPHRVRVTLDREGVIEITSIPGELPAEIDFANAEAGQSKFPRIKLSEQTINSTSPYVYHKTTLRDLYEKERQEAPDFFDVIFKNERGEITEGAITNIFIKKGDTFLTPALSCGLLNGTFRKHILDSNPDKIKEAVLFEHDLRAADAIYLTNSIRGVVQVELQ